MPFAEHSRLAALLAALLAAVRCASVRCASAENKMLAFMKTRRRDQHVRRLGSLASHLAAAEEGSGAVSTTAAASDVVLPSATKLVNPSASTVRGDDQPSVC